MGLAHLDRQAPPVHSRALINSAPPSPTSPISEGGHSIGALAGHEPGEAAVVALAEVVGGSRGHRDNFALWGYLGFLDDACLRWVHADCPDDQRHSLIGATLGCMEGALGDSRK